MQAADHPPSTHAEQSAVSIRRAKVRVEKFLWVPQVGEARRTVQLTCIGDSRGGALGYSSTTDFHHYVWT